MFAQIKDKFYDDFLKEPTKDNFRLFLEKNCGELDEVDFKEQWVDKGHLAKTILAMGNSRGGIIVVGVREEDDKGLTPVGLESFKDKATVNDEIAKYVPPGLDYEIFDFDYEASEYAAVQNKKFQLLIVHDTPERLPFISLNATTDLEKDVIYIRRGTKCAKATADEIEHIIEGKIATIFKETSDLTLDEHLKQLKKLYAELPQKIKVLVRKGSPSALSNMSAILSRIALSFSDTCGTPDEYEERDNPNYPEESYEAFVLRMIKYKKLKIEKVLDLK